MGLRENKQKMIEARDELVAGRNSMKKGNDHAAEVANLFPAIEDKKSEALDAARTVMQGLKMAAEGVVGLLLKLTEGAELAERMEKSATDGKAEFNSAYYSTVNARRILNAVLGEEETGRHTDMIYDGTHSAFTDHAIHVEKAQDVVNRFATADARSQKTVKQVAAVIGGLESIMRDIVEAGQAQDPNIAQLNYNPASDDKVMEYAGTLGHFGAAIVAVDDRIAEL